LYRRLLPRWASAQGAYDRDRDSCSPSASAGVFIAGKALFTFEIGQWFYDRVTHTTTQSEASDGAPPDDEPAPSLQDWLGVELAREGFAPAAFGLSPPYSDWIGTQAVGTRPRHWGNLALWREWPIQSSTPTRSVSLGGAQPLEPDSQIWRMIGHSHVLREVIETRMYGWPLRCIVVHGVRRHRWVVADPNQGDLVLVSQDDQWTDALVDFDHHSNWSFDADQPPATGLPWKPLLLPFLANSLILGVPAVLIATGLSRAIASADRWIRNRGDRSPVAERRESSATRSHGDGR
jgi:hypothetical protein